jgi:uncharacterized protein (TIGR02145 family)
MVPNPFDKNTNDEPDDTAYNEWLSRNALPVEVPLEEVRIGGETSTPRQDLGVEVGVVPNKSGFFYGWTKFLIVLVPLLFLIGYYSYGEVRASLTRIYSGEASIPSLATTTIGLTLTPDNLREGLVGHWTFDGSAMDWASTTAEAVDRSGNNNHGNVVNFTNSQVAIGKAGQALTFDKVDDYINAGSHASLDDLGPLTASMWIKPRSFGEGDAFGKLIGKDASVTAPGTWQLSFINGTNCVAGRTPIINGGIFFGNSGSTATLRSTRCSADNMITLNEWQHITVTWDGTGEGLNAPGIRLYKNGIEMSYATLSPASGIDPAGSDASLDLYIGNRPTNDRTFDGEIDDVRLYNRVLSPAEVAQLYSLGSGSTIKICKEESVQDADGNTYNTLAIGSQCWLDRNMNVGTRVNVATTQTNNSTIQKYCYDNLDSRCTTNNPNRPDGGLYQWDEAMQYSTTEGARGICPSGFHIPTDAEWHTLEKFLLDGGAACSSTRSGFGCAPAGIKLQQNGKSRFEGNVAGIVVDNTASYHRFSYGYYWTSSNFSSTSAMVREIHVFEPRLYRSGGQKISGQSVRCVQD